MRNAKHALMAALLILEHHSPLTAAYSQEVAETSVTAAANDGTATYFPIDLRTYF